MVQLGFVMLEIFIPLTGRSGTSVPGDVVQAGSFGLLLGLLMALSSRFLVVLPKEGLHRTLRLAFLLGVLMAIGQALSPWWFVVFGSVLGLRFDCLMPACPGGSQMAFIVS